MQIKVKDGYLIGYARIGGFPDGIEVDAALIEAIDPQKLYCYRYENGALTLDEEKWSAEQQAAEEAALKERYIPSVQNSMEAVARMALTALVPEDDDARIQASGLYADWSSGAYAVGDIRNAGGQTWECFQAHDNAVYPDIRPGNAAWYTFWRPLHGKSAGTARPFVAVQGAHDIYRAGEYMVWTDGGIYRCVSDTNFSPDEYAQAWEKEGTT